MAKCGECGDAMEALIVEVLVTEEDEEFDRRILKSRTVATIRAGFW